MYPLMVLGPPHQETGTNVRLIFEPEKKHTLRLDSFFYHSLKINFYLQNT